MKNLHLASLGNIIESYTKMINNNFNPNEHQFMIFENDVGLKIDLNNNVKILSTNLKSIKSLIIAMYKSEKIFLHGLFEYKIILLLFLQPWLLKKCYWIIWGADLYFYRDSQTTLKRKVYEVVRTFVIKRFSGLITHIRGDYELAKKWYSVRGKYFYSFIYPSNLYKEISISEKIDDTVSYIQVGNSANPSNNHEDIFEKLRSLNSKKIHIICPLSYGDKVYAKKVAKKGKEIFGDGFEPLLEFMPFEKYLEILSKIDIAIFNHDRQQAVGNITTLLGLGKKVFIRDSITTWDFCEEHNLKVYSISKDMNNVLIPIAETVRESNIMNTKEHFSNNKLVKDWEKIFNENYSRKKV